tara:strand:+ start:11 stop:385 length:375 start_codon:yes stop_codon:yes gene_type:complete
MEEKKYSKDHEWVKIQNDLAIIGISNHAQESLGDIVFISLPEIGKKVNSGDEVSVIESVKAASDIFNPIDGEIYEVNETLNNDASIINKDPENNGWIYKLKNFEKSQFDNLMSINEYEEFLKTE